MGGPSPRGFENSRITTLQGVIEGVLVVGAAAGGDMRPSGLLLALFLLSLALEERAGGRATGGVSGPGPASNCTICTLDTGLGCT